ncbi:MAG TPA: OmpA family protein [Desulfomonilia bacterium]|nr:OmpA family protein [Desulfomonilia bacterium]
MKRIFTFFLLVISNIIILGCAHRYSEEEYQALQNELNASKKQYEAIQADKTRLENELGETRKKLEKTSAETAAGCADKQALLDKNIDCMEENKNLLKQISRFRVITQERKDAQWRLDKANDYLSAVLSSERMNDQLYIVKADDAVKIIIPQRVLFPAPSSAWLMPKGISLVKKIAKGLNDLNPLSIEIAGHTDDTPISKRDLKVYPTQWDLANARAVSILLTLEGQGIKKDRLYAVSYGDTRPIADSTSEEGRAMNRRVEIVISP